MLTAVLLSVLTAALFGVNVYVQRAALADTDAGTGALLSVLGMAGLFWLGAPWFVQLQWFASPALGLFLLIGVIWPAMGQTLQVASVQKVGAALTMSIGSITPLVAIALAMVLVNEPITLTLAIGVLTMVAGLVVAAWGPKHGARPFAVWMLLLPAGAALARGLAQPLSKLGMETVPSPYFVTLVAGTVSSLVLCALYLLSKRPRRRSARGTWLFLFSGAVNGVGIFFLNSALALGQVGVVASIVATAPLWTLLFGAAWFEQEKLTIRHLLVAVFVFAGSVLVVGR
jgi:drug/metabolite transporter (DMT)-like permease